MRRWLPFALMAGVLVVALGIAAQPEVDRGEEARVERIAREVRCPTCQGLSVAESSAEAATAVKVFIRDRIREGASDGQIKAELVDRFGTGILLRPPATGPSAVLWASGVVVLVLGAGGLAYAFWRWRQVARRAPTDADVVLVESARRA